MVTLELEVLKPLLGLAVSDTSQDAVLTFILEDVQEVILNYCNLDELPNGLKNTAYRMAMDLYRNEGVGDADGAGGNVTSIKEGDTQVNFGATRYEATFAASVLKDYLPQLNRYRKLGWGNG
jgi:hypothetical protein